MDGLEISTDKLDLAAPDRGILSLSNFHKVSRAEGPKRTDEMRRPVSRGMRYAPNDRRARGAIVKETGYEKD
jgi:hypothetical protein